MATLGRQLMNDGNLGEVLWYSCPIAWLFTGIQLPLFNMAFRISLTHLRTMASLILICSLY